MKTLKVDSKGRITLGSLAKGFSSFNLEILPNSSYLLEPMVEIPAREKWLYDNKKFLQKVKNGLKQAKDKKISSLGSFSQYTKEED